MIALKEFAGKRFNDLISVIIPLYKSFDSSRVKMSIESLRAQKNVNLEIVVAEQSDKPSFSGGDIKYIFIPNEKNSNYARPGLVRNRAAKLSTGEYLYNSDGDIVYSNRFYFAEILELIKTGQEVVLYRPPMRRLPIENFKDLEKVWLESGIRGALNILELEGEFGVKMPNSTVSIIPFRKKESGKLKTFLYSSSDLKTYQEDPALKGSEPKFSTLAVHAGATLMLKEHFFAVGGFCERFMAWGCHDADLQWKLKRRYNLIEFPNFPEYEVLHLDHERVYFDKERWQANRKIQEERRKEGPEKAILADKNGL